MKFWLNLLISIDQFFNTIAGGEVDVTISGHVGYMAFSRKEWRLIQEIIDTTFAPIEKHHCRETWWNDDDIDTTDNLFTTSIVAIIGCALLFIPIRILGAFKHG
jgi:hypothetical protein